VYSRALHFRALAKTHTRAHHVRLEEVVFSVQGCGTVQIDKEPIHRALPRQVGSNPGALELVRHMQIQWHLHCCSRRVQEHAARKMVVECATNLII